MAKKKLKKVAKAASIALPRPVSSPYTSPLVTLQFGPHHQTYYLPEVLLERLENVPNRDPRTREINLVDVDANIGHVLIHFLHTGIYQSLDDGIEDSDNSIVCNEFQKAVLTLEAAEKYSVPGLKELAQIELERRGKEMCLRDAVRTIREEFIAGPPKKDAWLRDYVSKKVQWTFKHDPSALTAPDFFESIESPTLARLLARLIIGLYSDEVEQLREARAATGSVSIPGLQRLPSERIAVSSYAWPASVEELGAFDDSSAAWNPHNLDQNRSSRSEVSTLTVSVPCDQGERKEEALHTVEENAETTADGLEPRQPEMVLSSVNPTKKEMKFEVKTSYPLPESPLASLPLTTPIPPAPPHDIQLEARPTPAIAKVETVATITPAEHQDPKVEVDRYAGLSKSQARKLKVKLDTEAELKEEKERLRLEEEEEEVTAAAAEAAEAEPRKIEEEEATAAAAKVCVIDFNARIEKGATLDDDDCESRLEHLSRNEGWQNCKPCELYMRKIAIKLHSVGLPIVSGLGTID